MDAQQFEEEEEEAPGSSSACAVSSSKEKPHVFRVAHLRPIEEVMLERAPRAEGDRDRVDAECLFHGADFSIEDIAPIALQRLAVHHDTPPLDPHKAELLSSDQQSDSWNKHYSHHKSLFFPPKKYLYRVWPEVTDSDHPMYNPHAVVCEAGCGTGAALFSLLARNPSWRFYCFDFAPVALEEVRSNERLDADRVTLFQWDAATQELPMDIVPSQCCDFLFCVFMLSAVHPDLHVDTLRHMGDMLRPGGCILFRDYGIYDMRSLRFKPGQMVSPNYFLKGDGTTSYFFDSEYLGKVAQDAGFTMEDAQYHCNRLYSKQTKEEMFRVFLNAKLVKHSVLYPVSRVSFPEGVWRGGSENRCACVRLRAFARPIAEGICTQTPPLPPIPRGLQERERERLREASGRKAHGQVHVEAQPQAGVDFAPENLRERMSILSHFFTPQNLRDGSRRTPCSGCSGGSPSRLIP